MRKNSKSNKIWKTFTVAQLYYIINILPSKCKSYSSERLSFVLLWAYSMFSIAFVLIYATSLNVMSTNWTQSLIFTYFLLIGPGLKRFLDTLILVFKKIIKEMNYITSVLKVQTFNFFLHYFCYKKQVNNL